jgi:hypothetical protein
MSNYNPMFKPALLRALDEEIKDYHGKVITGSFANGDKSTDRIAFEYAKFIGYIKALERVEQIIRDVEQELNED